MLDLQGKENIIFDLGGVLLNIDYNRTAQAFKKLGLTSFDDIYSQQEQTQLFDRFETGQIGEDFFVDEVAKTLPDVARSEIIAAWNAMLLDFPIHRLELLKKLRTDYRIVLLSNTNAIHEKAFSKIITSTFGKDILGEVFEQVYLSHKIGYRKPTKDCFEFVLADCSFLPERTVFIDDSIQHVEGAREAGIAAFHLLQGSDVTELFPDKFQPAFHS